MVNTDNNRTPADLLPKIERMWELSGQKILAIEKSWEQKSGSPVITKNGIYDTQGWTEWTQGFQVGAHILQFDATGNEAMLASGRALTVDVMASHVTHVGVHDHGFNNVSTYGALRRLMNEGRIDEDPFERDFYELALKSSGAVQAHRWTNISDGTGYIYSFNGPHSLFSDTIRSLRSLALAHSLGHVLMSERDEPVSLLQRMIHHARTTARFNVYYGEGRDTYDERGRVVHESIFNLNDGNYRCPSSQQGYSPFSTWTRGLAWIMCGYTEQLEFLATLDTAELEPLGGRDDIESMMLKAATASCDFYLKNTPPDGVPYWDTGAPELHKLGDYLDKPADPFNQHEPVDSSAAAIGAQGLLRLGKYLESKGLSAEGAQYFQAGLHILDTLLDQPYLSTGDAHQGLLLHSIYHRPNAWDTIPKGSKIPAGESSMWGDYHLRELALYVQRIAKNQPYYTFFA